MRKSSQVLIYIDTTKAMANGIKFYISANGVILTEGNEEGFLLKEFFEKVERSDGKPVPDDWRTN
jgi:2'-phosphotransferase